MKKTVVLCVKCTAIWAKEKCSVGDPWHFGADRYLWLMVLNPDPDSTPDPTSFFIDFWGCKKKYFFLHIFLITCLPAHNLQSKKFNCVKILFCMHHFSPLKTSMRKGKDSEPDPYLWLMDPEPGGPKHADPPGPDLQHWEKITKMRALPETFQIFEQNFR